MNLIALITTAASALLGTYLLGYLVLRACTRFNDPECWAFSGISGIALLAGIAFAAFGCSTFSRLAYVGPTVMLAVLSIMVLRRRRRPLFPQRPPAWLLAGITLWLALLCVQLISLVYTGAFWYGDWWMHYDIAQFYLGLRDPHVRYFGMYTIVSRPPLFNLAATFYLAVFGNSFAVYQVVSLIPGLAVLGPLILLARPKRASLLVALVALNPYLVNQLLYPWPKLLASALVLAGLSCYLAYRSTTDVVKRSYLIGSGIWIGLAILTHTSTVIYAIGMAIDYLWLHRRNLRHALAVSFVVVAPAVGVMAPWLIWSAHLYGPAAIITSTPTVAATGRSVSPVGWAWDRLSTMVGTLFPIPAVMLVGLVTHVPARIAAYVWSPLRDAWLRSYYSMLPGAFTYTLTACVCVYLWLRRRRRPVHHGLPLLLINTLAVTGFLGGILLQPGLNAQGVAGEGMAPLVLLFLVVAVAVIEELGPRLRWVVLSLTALEFLATRGVHTMILALGLFNGMDEGNLKLKQQYQLLFARDVVGGAWPLVSAVAILAYVVLFHVAWASEDMDAAPVVPGSPKRTAEAGYGI